MHKLCIAIFAIFMASCAGYPRTREPKTGLTVGYFPTERDKLIRGVTLIDTTVYPWRLINPGDRDYERRADRSFAITP
jgi:hypothetical protein